MKSCSQWFSIVALLASSLNTLTASPSPLSVDFFSTLNFTGSSTAQNTLIAITNSSTVNFLNNSTAGNAQISVDGTSILNFKDSSSASSAQIALSGTLNFNQSSADVFNGTITGSSGSVNKTGTGNLTFNGNNSSYTGPLTVLSGTLFLNGAFGGSVTVDPSAEIVYNGPISGDLNVGNGTITTLGTNTLQVLGNYSQLSGGTYIVNVNGALSSRIDIGGTASIAGFVQTGNLNNIILNHPYTILSANGGVSGTYTLLNAFSAVLRGQLSYDARDVFLTFSRLWSFLPLAETPNQAHVANAIDSITVASADELSVISVLNALTVPQTQNALDQMSGEQYTLFIPTTFYDDFHFERRIYNAYRTLMNPCCSPVCGAVETWVGGGGGESYFRGNSNSKGDRNINGDVNVGFHSFFSRNWLLGVALGYENDRLHFRLPGSTTLETVEGAIYSALRGENCYFLADIIGGWSWASWHRPIAFGTIDRRASGEPKIAHGRINGEVGLNLFTNCCFLLKPYLSMSASGAHQHRIRERGAESLNLEVSPKTQWLGSSELGCHLIQNRIEDLSIEMDIAWEHDFGKLSINEKTRFRDFGDAFGIEGPSRGHNGAIGALYLSTPLFCQWELYGQALGEVWKNWYTYEVSGGVVYRW